MVAGLIFLLPSARADSPSSFILVQCMSSIDRLEINTFMTWSVCDGCERTATLVKQGIYELGDFIQRYSKRPFECDLGAGQKAVVSILDHWPGKVLPGMRFDVKINGRQVVLPQRLNGDDDELDLQVQAFPASAQPIEPASVSTNLCRLEARDPLSLPRSIRCERALVNLGEGTPTDQTESAEYERVAPRK
jgi:hypothetical protein